MCGKTGKEELTIIVDTREQQPLWEENSAYTRIVRKKLDVGDYSVEGYEDIICIERKSPMDAFGTLGSKTNHARFNKELERAQTLEYFAVVIELGILPFINKDFENSFRTKIMGFSMFQAWITHSIRRGYHIFFTNSRAESKTLIRAVLKTFVKERKKRK